MSELTIADCGLTIGVDPALSFSHVITCRCGARGGRKYLLLDPTDPQRIRDTLSEDCPVCRVSNCIEEGSHAHH